MYILDRLSTLHPTKRRRRKGRVTPKRRKLKLECCARGTLSRIEVVYTDFILFHQLFEMWISGYQLDVHSSKCDVIRTWIIHTAESYRSSLGEILVLGTMIVCDSKLTPW